MISLKGQFLVAMPEMTDERFKDTVIYLVGHSDEGAMGLVVNKTIDDMNFGDILEELNLGEHDEVTHLPEGVRKLEVLRGGPVELGRGFVLHSADYYRDGNSFEVNEDVVLTATLEVLRAMAFGAGPQKALFALGYCGWGAGQLEGELGRNGWLTVPYSDDLLFGVPLDKRYDEALKKLGITRASLSSTAGNA